MQNGSNGYQDLSLMGEYPMGDLDFAGLDSLTCILGTMRRDSSSQLLPHAGDTIIGAEEDGVFLDELMEQYVKNLHVIFFVC